MIQKQYTIKSEIFRKVALNAKKLEHVEFTSTFYMSVKILGTEITKQHRERPLLLVLKGITNAWIMTVSMNWTNAYMVLCPIKEAT